VKLKIAAYMHAKQVSTYTSLQCWYEYCTVQLPYNNTIDIVFDVLYTLMDSFPLFVPNSSIQITM